MAFIPATGNPISLGHVQAALGGTVSSLTSLNVAGNLRSANLSLLTGNIAAATLSSAASQVSFAFGGGGYSHAIKSRHDATSTLNNALDFWLWNYGVDTQNTNPSKPVMSICGNGNVGINTFSPSYNLDVNGTSRISSTVDSPLILNVTSTSGANNYGRFIGGLSPNQSTNEAFIMNVGQGNSYCNSAYFGFAYQSAGNVASYATIGLYGVDRILNVSGNRNVGINTTTPSYSLDVNGTARFAPSSGISTLNAVMMSTANNGATLTGLYISDANKGVTYSGGNYSPAQYFAGSAPTDGLAVFGWVDGCLGTKANGNKSSVYWNSSNGVGINNIAPACALDVTGSARISGNALTLSTVTSIYGTGVGISMLSNPKINETFWAVSGGGPGVTTFGLYTTTYFTVNSGATFSLYQNYSTNPSYQTSSAGGIQLNGGTFGLNYDFSNAPYSLPYTTLKSMIAGGMTVSLTVAGTNASSGTWSNQPWNTSCGISFNGVLLFNPAANSGAFNNTYDVTSSINSGGANFNVNTNMQSGYVAINSVVLSFNYGSSAVNMQITGAAGNGAIIGLGQKTGQAWNIGCEQNNNFRVYNNAGTGVYLANGSTSWSANSDRRLKKNIIPIKSDLDRLVKLTPVKFNWNAENDSDEQHYGLIAQNVKEVYPELVNIADNGMFGVSYADFIPIILSAIKDLKEENCELRRQLETVMA